jgi:phage terminase large subunit GpA-like protein
LALTLWGYGPGEEAWCIGWSEIFGAPSDRATWAALDEFLAREFAHELGGMVKIKATCVDAGDGQTTGYVLDYCRTRFRRRVLAIKGQSQDGKPPIGKPTKVDVNVRGVTLPGSALLWPVGSSGIKRWLMDRVRGEGMVHFPADLPPEFYEQLTAERLVTKFSKGFAKKEWVKANNARNEALDASVYAYAAACWAGLKRANWARLRGMAEKSTAGGLAAPPSDDRPPDGSVPTRRGFAPPRKGGFVNGWK